MCDSPQRLFFFQKLLKLKLLEAPHGPSSSFYSPGRVTGGEVWCTKFDHTFSHRCTWPRPTSGYHISLASHPLTLIKHKQLLVFYWLQIPQHKVHLILCAQQMFWFWFTLTDTPHPSTGWWSCVSFSLSSVCQRPMDSKAVQTREVRMAPVALDLQLHKGKDTLCATLKEKKIGVWWLKKTS